MSASGRPGRSEYDPYYEQYVALVPDGDISETLEEQITHSLELLASIPPEREEYRYAPDKWSVREVVGHLIDVERLFAFRCLWAARGAEEALPPMDQDAWAAVSNAGSRTLEAMANEWNEARAGAVALYRGLDDEAWARWGVASGKRYTARAAAWIAAGHELHHRHLLRRDYLGEDV